MAYNILGITPGHNSSICVLSDGEIIYFLEEERLSRLKRDGNPIKTLISVLDNYKIDEVVISGVNYQLPTLVHTLENLYVGILRKYYKNTIPPITYVYQHHHLIHSLSSFYNSGFNKSLSIVIDSSGSTHNHKIDTKVIEGDEVESIFIQEHPLSTKTFSSTHFNPNIDSPKSQPPYNIINTIGIGKAYEAITEYLGFKGDEDAGKTMGLSSYGKPSNLPTIISKNFRNKELFVFEDKGGCYLPLPHIKENTLNFYSKKDIAWKIQDDTQKMVGDIIEEAVKKTNIKQVCCSGGYFLNCVTNYYLIKRFPDIEFYFEPISNDAGTSIGSTKLAWHEKTQDTTIRPQKTLYYGPKYSKEELLEGIKKYVDTPQ